MKMPYFTCGSARMNTCWVVGLGTPSDWATLAAMVSSVVGCISVEVGPVANETNSSPSLAIEMYVGGLDGVVGAWAGGMSILIDTVASGAVTMKMISSTSITSTNGVTLMS